MKILSLCLCLITLTSIATAQDGWKIYTSKLLPVVNQEFEIRVKPPADAEFPVTVRLDVGGAGGRLDTELAFDDATAAATKITATDTGYLRGFIDFGNGFKQSFDIPVVWRELYFSCWGPPEPHEREAHGYLNTHVIHTEKDPEIVKYWKDYGSQVIAWIGAPRSDDSGNIPLESMESWCDAIGEFLDMGCDGVFVDEFGAYPNESGIVRMRSISKMMKMARERFPDMLLMPATAGAIQRELAIGYKEAGAIAMLEMYPTCMTRFFYSHSVRKHLDQRIETVRNTDLIHHADQPQGAIVLLGTRVIGSHEEPVVAEIEDFVRYIKKTAPEMPGIGFYGGRYDGMTEELNRMIIDYYIKPVVDVRAIRFSPWSPRQDETVDILVNIHNLGGMAARDVRVKVFATQLGTSNKAELGTIEIARIGNDTMDLKPSEGLPDRAHEFQEINGNRYVVYPQHNVVFLARTTGKVTWTPPKAGYYTITAEVQSSNQHTILDGAMQETLHVRSK